MDTTQSPGFTEPVYISSSEDESQSPAPPALASPRNAGSRQGTLSGPRRSIRPSSSQSDLTVSSNNRSSILAHNEEIQLSPREIETARQVAALRIAEDQRQRGGNTSRLCRQEPVHNQGSSAPIISRKRPHSAIETSEANESGILSIAGSSAVPAGPRSTNRFMPHTRGAATLSQPASVPATPNPFLPGPTEGTTISRRRAPARSAPCSRPAGANSSGRRSTRMSTVPGFAIGRENARRQLLAQQDAVADAIGEPLDPRQIVEDREDLTWRGRK